MRARKRTARDPRTSEDIEVLARLLDDIVRIPGTRIRLGLDAVLGLLPGGGDVIGGALSAWIIFAAVRLGAPPSVIARMGLNVLVDTVVGAVPVLGDVFDIAWRANRRNVDLLGRYLREPAPARRSSRVVLAVVLLVLVAALAGAVLFAIWLVRWIAALF